MPGSDFQRALQDAFDNGRVLELHDDVTLDQPVEVSIKSSYRGWFGLDGRFHKITSRVQDQPALRIYMEDVHGVCARCMFVGNFSMEGCGEETALLRIEVPVADSWLVNPELRSLWFEGSGGDGFQIIGSIFEGNLYSVGTMNCLGNGGYFAHANGGIVSALRWFGGTQRQNGGHGVCVDAYDGPYDVRLFGLYLCENAGFGVSMLAGCASIDGCGFENNHGGAGIYFCNRATLAHCNGSTWGPQGYLVKAFLANDCLVRGCAVEGYSGGDPKLAFFEGEGAVWLTGSGDGTNVDRSGSVRVIVTG